VLRRVEHALGPTACNDGDDDVTLPKAYFIDLYSRNRDPWRISVRWYEQRKRSLLLAALPQARYRRAFEPGCANGDLTLHLAQRADQLLAWDAVPQAVETCRAAVAERAAALGAVTVEVGAVPTEWPSGEFDLIVLSELCCYLSEVDLRTLLSRAVDSLSAEGTLAAVHWRHEAPGYPRTGDVVHSEIADTAGLACLASYLDEDMALDVLIKTSGEPRSVARASGLLS
jgi:SAM-dependent methyltransferase